MDQHEKDWLDLGRQLKDYTPAGNPSEDFQTFQKLQNQEPRRKKRGAFWISISLSILVVLTTVGVITYGDSNNLWQADKLALSEQGIVPAVESSLAVEDQPADRPAAKPELVKVETVVELPAENSRVGRQLNRQKDMLAERVVMETKEGTRALQSATVLENVLPAPSARLVTTNKVAKTIVSNTSGSNLVAKMLPANLITPLPEAKNSSDYDGIVLKKPSSILQITLGTGLSNHWRGANFMQEVDRGIYAYIGVNRRIGQRFGLEGRIGYRGHDMRLPVVSDVDAPWSYHKEEIHNTGHMGEDRAYIYEGVVEGYQAVEFSLLAHYQFSSRLSASGGVRYSLPDLAFERTVMGPDEENPFFEFIDRQPLVKYQDYGALLGLEYHFSRSLVLEGGLHLGMVDLIDDAAAGRTRFNHSSSVSIGVKYKLE